MSTFESRQNQVNVLELTDQFLAQLAQAAPVNIDLGAKALNSLEVAMKETGLEDRVRQFRDRSQKVYVLQWTGGRSPRGAKLGDTVVGFAQHSMLRDLESRDIGTYDRLVDGGGDMKNEHVMIAFIYKTEGHGE